MVVARGVIVRVSSIWISRILSLPFVCVELQSALASLLLFLLDNDQACRSLEASYIFITKLIGGQVDRPKRSSPNFLFDHILIDVMFGRTIVLAGSIFGAGVQCFLTSQDDQIECVDGIGDLTFTARLALGSRWRCRWGLSTEGADLHIC